MRRLAALLLPLALMGGAGSAAAPTVVGIAAAVVNDVRIKGAAARQFARAALLQRVALADQVQTGGGSRLQLVLLDKSKFTVGANARLTIDRFVYDPSGGSMSASVAKGAFRFMSGRTSGNSNKSINSPAATIGIRGTLLDGVVGAEAVAIARGERDVRGNVQHDPATATLIVLRGPGPKRQGNDAVGEINVTAGGKTVMLDRPLMAAYVPYAGARPITFSISSSGVARLNDMLIEPRDIVDNPNAPGQPYAAQPEPERPYYDRPPRGGFDGGGDNRRGGGGYGLPGNIPGLNGGLPGMGDRPRDRPQRERPSTTTTTPQSDTTTSPYETGSTSPPASSTGQSGTNIYLQDSPRPNSSPSTSNVQSNPDRRILDSGANQVKPASDDYQVR